MLTTISRYYWVYFNCWVLSSSVLAASNTAQSVDVGVLATRGSYVAQLRWQPTLDWLAQRIPNTRFVLHPLTLDEMRTAVIQGKIDFIITNPGQAVQLGRQYSLSWVATMLNHSPVSNTQGVGSVLVVRNDAPYQKFSDLAGLPIAAISPQAFGGYLTLSYELTRQNLNPNDYFSNVHFVGFPIDVSLYQLRDNSVEGAVVPVCLLETMTKEGVLEKGKYRAINNTAPSGFPCQVSTELYPNWSFAQTDRTSNELAKQISRVLLSMPPESTPAKAAGGTGWTSPVSLLAIDKLYQKLDMHPLQKPWWQEALTWFRLHQHWAWTAFLFLLLLNAYHFWLEYRFSRSKSALEKTQHDLKEKSEMLEHAQRVQIVGELGSSIAHEMNQPLAAIRNYSEGGLKRLSKQGTVENIAAIFNNIHTQVERADAIISRLRTMIKKRTSEKNICEFEPLLYEALALLEQRLKKHNIHLIKYQKGDSYVLYVDPIALQQVLVNVVNNAIDACIAYQEQNSPSDWQATLSIHCHFSAQLFKLTIEDNGLGLSIEAAQMVQPFMSTKKDGLGLGLAICQYVMDDHHGRITLEPTTPHGCRVTLFLPNNGEEKRG